MRIHWRANVSKSGVVLGSMDPRQCSSPGPGPSQRYKVCFIGGLFVCVCVCLCVFFGAAVFRSFSENLDEPMSTPNWE
jgi:hypothetical protein